MEKSSGQRLASLRLVPSAHSKDVRFSSHALDRLAERGATEAEVRVAIREGRMEPARAGRRVYSQIFHFDRSWMGKRYRQRGVRAVVVEEPTELIVVTVYVFYYPAGGLP